jgi:acyl-CoA synthetase (AMP-forming)/AMP-acid ligase II
VDEHPGPLDVPSALRAAAAAAPGAAAVVDGDLRLTYAQLAEQADEFARALIAVGVQPGDTVAIWAPNSARWIIAALGTLAARAVLVPVNTRYKGAEAHYLLARARVVLLAVDDGFLGNNYLDMLRRADTEATSTEATSTEATSTGPVLPGLPHLRTVVAFGTSGDPAARPCGDFLAGAGAVDPAEVDARVAALTPGTLCDIIFTSGTSGTPKGVMTCHGTAVRNAAAWADGMGLRTGDRYLLVNPFFHTFGYRAGILACLTRQATMYPLKVFDADAVLAIADAEKITVLPGPPTLFHSILGHPRRAGFDLAIRLVATGAASVPRALMERISGELGVETVSAPYGLTEVSGTATMQPPGAPAEKVLTTVGRAIPGTEIAIAGQDGRPLPPGRDGEILIRGYHVMLGYLDDPRATAEAVDADGWLHTGDVGHLDDEKYLTVTGRIKEVFQTGGFNVYPVEVEQLLATHPMIAEAAVIGVPDERLGEVGHAFVIPRPGRAPDPAEVIAFARERLANFKVPRAVTVVAELPRTPLGKVQKFRLPRVPSQQEETVSDG